MHREDQSCERAIDWKRGIVAANLKPFIETSIGNNDRSFSNETIYHHEEIVMNDLKNLSRMKNLEALAPRP
ncbi:MAG: hypothetical protein K0R53_3520 [Burkholderiales bacterium]|nr:hypothetical protein [Burkholderiales bacterium]